MKNFDLAWARDWAKLSQVAAAELMGVTKKTWGRWEAGSHPTPAGALKRFIELTKMPAEVQSQRRVYDYRSGYPRGFNRQQFLDEAEAAAEASGEKCYDEDRAYEAEDAALREIEGDEYEERARERYRLLMVGLGMSDAYITAALAELDAETERIEKQTANVPAGGPSAVL